MVTITWAGAGHGTKTKPPHGQCHGQEIQLWACVDWTGSGPPSPGLGAVSHKPGVTPSFPSPGLLELINTPCPLHLFKVVSNISLAAVPPSPTWTIRATSHGICMNSQCHYQGNL